MSCKQEEDSTLMQSIAVAKALKQQNEELNFAFDDLKKEYIALEEELINLRKEHQHEIEAKKSLEIECQNLYKKWNDELKIQAQEFEKIQSEMIPNTELQLLRVKVLEELEISYNKKLNWMKNEMDKYQNLYSKTLRQLQILKLNHQNTQKSFQTILNQKEQNLNYKINKLKQENEALKHNEIHNDTLISLKHKIQELKTENMEYNQQIECIQKQIIWLNQQNSTLNRQNEEIKCLNITQIKELKGKVLIKNTEWNGLKQRYCDIQNEFEIIKKKHLSKEEEIQKLENNENHFIKQIEQKKKEILNLNDAFSNKEKMNKEKHYKQCNLLNQKILNLENKIHSLYKDKENLNTKINKQNNHHLIATQQIKQHNFTNFNNLIESKQELDKQYQSVKCKLNKLQNQNEKEIDSLTNHLDKQTMKIQQIEREKQNISQINKNKDKEIQDLLNDIQCLKKENTEITAEYQTLTNKHRDILDTNYQLTSKETKYVTQIEYLEIDINEINNKIDNKINEMNQNKNENEKSLNKLKKEKSKYKKLATTTKTKVNTLSTELINIKKHFLTELNAKELQITNLNKQIYQIQREQLLHTTNTISSVHNKTDLITNNVDILLKELQIEQNEMNNTKRMDQPNDIHT